MRTAAFGLAVLAAVATQIYPGRATSPPDQPAIDPALSEGLPAAIVRPPDPHHGWRADWPGPNSILPRAPVLLAEVQTMGTGSVDYFLPPSPDNIPAYTWRVRPFPNACTDPGCPPPARQPDCTADPCLPVSNPPTCTGAQCPPVSNPPTCSGGECPPPRIDPPGCSEPGCSPENLFPACGGWFGAPPGPPSVPDNRVPPGFALLSPDGKPLDNVSLSQPFLLEFRVRTEDLKIDQSSPTFTAPAITVTLRSTDGSEDRVTLRSVGTLPGVMVFRTPEPVSIGGEAGNMDYEGTVNDLGLEFDTGSEVHIVQLLGGTMLGGTSALRVHANPIQQGIAANRDLLQQIAELLSTERAVAEGLLANPEVAADPERVKEVQTWLQRIGTQEAMVQRGLGYIGNGSFPIYQLRYSSFFLNRLVTAGPNGLQLAQDAPTGFGLAQDLASLDQQLRNEYGTSAIISPAAMGVISAYVVGGTTTFAHLTGGAAINQLLTGKDMFGNEASRGWAAVELGATVAAIILPPKIIDFLAGRGINNFGFEISIGGRPTRIILPRQAGQLAWETNRGQSALPSAQTAPRVGRAPGTGQLPPGASVSNLPARRQGMPTQEAQYWQGQVDKLKPANNPLDIEFVQYHEAQSALANMDNAIAVGRSQGVPQPTLDNLLARSRDMTVFEASDFVIREVEFALVTGRGDRLFVSPDDVGALSGLYTPQQIGQMTPCNLRPLEGVITKARLEADGKPQFWTVDEVQALRDLDRRIGQGEDLSKWRNTEVRETGNPDSPFALEGFEPVFTPDALGAIRAAAARPLRFSSDAATGTGSINLPPSTNAVPGPAAFNPINVPGNFGGPSGFGGAQAPIEIVIRSTGGSTGPVLEGALVNYGAPIRFLTSGLVLEPATPDQVHQSANRLDEIFKALSGDGTISQLSLSSPGEHGGPNEEAEASGAPVRGRVVRLALDAYCLEFLKAVPVTGTLFRIASQARQRTAGTLRGILDASARLQAAAALHPDGNPESYFHAVRQWAIWVDERKLGRGQFETEFLKHAQKNFAAAGQPWNREVEQAVRAVLPNRWQDISAVLQEAERAGNRRGDAP